jgi:hypothetical protein
VIQSVGASSCSSGGVAKRRSAGVMERWSIGVSECCDSSRLVLSFLLITVLLITGYFLGTRTSWSSSLPITFHFSPFPSLPRSINERASGQYDNQDGSFGSDLPIR